LSKEYHAVKALSSHQLMDLYKSPELWKHKQSHPFEATDSMDFGSLVHCLILNPQDFEAEFIVSPKLDKRTKEGKAAAAEFEASANGRIVVSVDQLEKAQAMRDRVLISPTASELLEKAQTRELPMYYEFRGHKAKMKPDAFGPDIILDYKTTSSLDGFKYDFKKYNYDLQAAWYRRGDSVFHNSMKKKDFYIIAQETVAPFQVDVFKIKEETLGFGWDKVEIALANLRLAESSGIWFGTDQQIKEL
jgi:hypothetical protein